MTERFMIFGKYSDVRTYARQHNLALGTWYHACRREQVMGINPSQFSKTVVIGPLDTESKAALDEWTIRCAQ